MTRIAWVCVRRIALDQSQDDPKAPPSCQLSALGQKLGPRTATELGPFAPS